MRYARRNVFKYSFFNRVVETLNSLPFSIREATSVNIFKALVRKVFFYGLVWYLNDFLFVCLLFVPLVFCYNMGSLTLLHYIHWLLL